MNEKFSNFVSGIHDFVVGIWRSIKPSRPVLIFIGVVTVCVVLVLVGLGYLGAFNHGSGGNYQDAKATTNADLQELRQRLDSSVERQRSESTNSGKFIDRLSR